MTKQQEIDYLRRVCHHLGDRNKSYTGEWLAAELPNLERAILDDFPAETYAKTYREAEAIRTGLIDEAKAYAKGIREDALRNAETVRKEMEALNSKAEKQRNDLRNAITEATDYIRAASRLLSVI